MPITNRPPSGIASRALMQRFSSALSSSLGSHSTRARPSRRRSSRRTAGPTDRRTRSAIPATSASGSTGFGFSRCRRAKASNRRVSPAARLTDCRARSRKRSASAARPSPVRRRAMSRLPAMPCSMLLKSCARPPVSWPTASIFCACRSAASACSRCRISAWRLSNAFLSSAVRSATRASSSSRPRASTSRARTWSSMSVEVPNHSTMRPAASRTGVARLWNQRHVLSAAWNVRCSTENSPRASASAQAAIVAARSSGWTASSQPRPTLSSSDWPA